MDIQDYPRQAIEPRFWPKVDCSGGPAACWLWTASRYPSGYGRFGVGGKCVSAHVVAYLLTIGPIPAGLVIDHVKARGCQHRHCVNPRHLEAVTQRVNVLRGDGPPSRNARKTHCPHGHEYTPENTRQSMKGGSLRRVCRTCERTYNARYREAA